MFRRRDAVPVLTEFPNLVGSDTRQVCVCVYGVSFFFSRVQNMEFHNDGNVSNATHLRMYAPPNGTSSALPNAKQTFKIHKRDIWFRGIEKMPYRR